MSQIASPATQNERCVIVLISRSRQLNLSAGNAGPKWLQTIKPEEIQFILQVNLTFRPENKGKGSGDLMDVKLGSEGLRGCCTHFGGLYVYCS